MAEKKNDQRPRRKRQIGIVTSNRMNKTIVVRVDWLYEVPKYGKRVRRHTKYYAHDEHNVARIGDEAAVVQDVDPRQVALVEQALPCSLSLTTAQEDVQVTQRGNNTIALDVKVAADGVLVLSEVAYPGWRAFVDGERVPMIRAYYTLRAVCVPAGTHQVTFSFLPTSLIIGAAITVLAWLLVGLAGAKLRMTNATATRLEVVAP